MTKTSNRIIFFGSGPVAAKSLELLAQTFDIEAVVTKPKPAHHRGTFPVLDSAEGLKLPVHTVSNKAGLSELMATKPFQSKLGVLIDFGIIVSQDVIDYFPLGIVNSHFSILPEWRGADPITFAILSGQEQTGVSLMLLVEKMDEGPLLAQSELEIDPKTTTPLLTDELVDLSAQMLAEVLPIYIVGDIKPYEQPSKPPVSYSRKLTKADGLIDWAKPAGQIEREIRAFIEWPKSQTRLASKEIVVTAASVSPQSAVHSPKTIPGTVIVQGKDLLVVCGQDSLLSIEKLKPAGKNEMTIQAFLAGYKV